jgi:hypothetical protein
MKIRFKTPFDKYLNAARALHARTQSISEFIAGVMGIITLLVFIYYIATAYGDRVNSIKK